MTWTGNALICKTLAETHPKAQCDESSLIELMDDLLSSDNTAVANGLKTINARLTFSTYSAVTCSISDLSLWGAIKGNPQTFNQVLSGKYPQITRWYKELMDTSSMTTQAAQFVKDATVVSSKRCI
jgi:glutathione S-transferase